MKDTLETLEELYAAVVADVLDELGYREQTLSSDISALTSSNKICGRVFTGEAETVKEIPPEPYKLEMQAIDEMNAGDVFVLDGKHHSQCSFWGELLSTACIAKGVRGVVMSACTRDAWKLKKMDFPVFGIGYTPADSKGRIDVVSIREPIEVDGESIRTGDYLIGDDDGVVIIPQDALGETLRLAEEKVSGENLVRDQLAAGVPVAEVFEKFGIL